MNTEQLATTQYSVSRAHHVEVAQTGSMQAQFIALGLPMLITSQTIECICKRDLVLTVLTHLPLLTCVLLLLTERVNQYYTTKRSE